MQCSKCGHVNPLGYSFCERCGALLQSGGAPAARDPGQPPLDKLPRGPVRTSWPVVVWLSALTWYQFANNREVGRMLCEQSRAASSWSCRTAVLGYTAPQLRNMAILLLAFAVVAVAMFVQRRRRNRPRAAPDLVPGR